MDTSTFVNNVPNKLHSLLEFEEVNSTKEKYTTRTQISMNDEHKQKDFENEILQHQTNQLKAIENKFEIKKSFNSIIIPSFSSIPDLPPKYNESISIFAKCIEETEREYLIENNCSEESILLPKGATNLVEANFMNTEDILNLAPSPSSFLAEVMGTESECDVQRFLLENKTCNNTDTTYTLCNDSEIEPLTKLCNENNKTNLDQHHKASKKMQIDKNNFCFDPESLIEDQDIVLLYCMSKDSICNLSTSINKEANRPINNLKERQDLPNSTLKNEDFSNFIPLKDNENNTELKENQYPLKMGQKEDLKQNNIDIEIKENELSTSLLELSISEENPETNDFIGNNYQEKSNILEKKSLLTGNKALDRSKSNENKFSKLTLSFNEGKQNYFTSNLKKHTNDQDVKRMNHKNNIKSPLDIINSIVTTNAEIDSSQSIKSYDVPYTSKNILENNDINDPDWELLKKLRNDTDRYHEIRKYWKNLIVPDLNCNMTLHNFRQRRNKGYPLEDTAGKVIKKRQREDDFNTNFQNKRAKICNSPTFNSLQFNEKAVEDTKDFLVADSRELKKYIRAPFLKEKIDFRLSEYVNQLYAGAEEVQALHNFYIGLPNQGNHSQTAIENEQEDINDVYNTFTNVSLYNWNERIFNPVIPQMKIRYHNKPY